MPHARLLLPAAAALTLHAALLLGTGGHTGNGPAGSVAATGPARTPALQVRWVARPPLASTAAPVPDLPAEHAPADMAGLSAPPAPLPPSEGPTDALPSSPVQARHATEGPSGPAEEGGTLAWLPRQALTQPPQALAPIVIDYPAGVHPPGPLVHMKLALYIDERGHVRRTEPIGERLEAAFERAANNAFLQARFTPGQLGPHVVRTRLVVEVAFEALPEQGAEARGVRITVTP